MSANPKLMPHELCPALLSSPLLQTLFYPTLSPQTSTILFPELTPLRHLFRLCQIVFSPTAVSSTK